MKLMDPREDAIAALLLAAGHSANAAGKLLGRSDKTITAGAERARERKYLELSSRERETALELGRLIKWLEEGEAAGWINLLARLIHQKGGE
jgi:transposase